MCYFWSSLFHLRPYSLLSPSFLLFFPPSPLPVCCSPYVCLPSYMLHLTSFSLSLSFSLPPTHSFPCPFHISPFPCRLYCFLPLLSHSCMSSSFSYILLSFSFPYLPSFFSILAVFSLLPLLYVILLSSFILHSVLLFLLVILVSYPVPLLPSSLRLPLILPRLPTSFPPCLRIILSLINRRCLLAPTLLMELTSMVGITDGFKSQWKGWEGGWREEETVFFFIHEKRGRSEGA